MLDEIEVDAIPTTAIGATNTTPAAQLQLQATTPPAPQSTAGKEWLGSEPDDCITAAQYAPIAKLLADVNDRAALLGKRYGVSAPLKIKARDHADLLQFAALLKAIGPSVEDYPKVAAHCGVDTIDRIAPERLSDAMNFIMSPAKGVTEEEEKYCEVEPY